jgi:hypothetical protein
VQLRITLTVRVIDCSQAGYCDPRARLIVCKAKNDAMLGFEGTLVHEIGHATGQSVWKETLSNNIRVRANHHLGTTFNAENWGGIHAPSPGLKQSDHGETYVGHGHLGVHCSVGLNENATHEKRIVNGKARVFQVRNAQALSDYSRLCDKDGKPAAGECVMYGEGESEHGFCEKCLVFLKARDLRQLPK